MQPDAILALFEELVADLRDALDGLEDWGLSGLKDGQYNHDLVADELLIAPLLERGFSVLTEESGVTQPEPGSGTDGNGLTVVIDPVDGSTNASHGLPWYASSLCVVDAHGPWVSLVTNLALGDTFRAVRGNGVEADVATFAPSAVTDLSDALLAFSGLPPSHGGWRQYRTYGAAALDMCAVAAGTFDAFVDVDGVHGQGAHGVWDYLGALLVCSEAGAVVADANGLDLVPLDHASRRAPIAAATPELMNDVIAMIETWRLQK